MTLTGIIVVLLSALCHTCWNTLSKLSNAAPMTFLSKALMYTSVMYFPLFVWMQFHITYTPTYTMCVLASGCFCGCYFFSLASAYEHGDISIAYPVARSFPILVLAWAGLLLDEVPSVLGIFGICLIIFGCFVLPIKKFKFGKDGFSIKNYMNISCFWALMAALCTSFYSMTDKYAAIENKVDPWALESILAKVNYVYLQNLMAFIIITIILKLKKYQFKEVKKTRVAIAGFIFLIAYALVMIAFVENKTAYVVSFRQLSIVLTAVLSMLLIEKRFSKMRLTGALIIFVGVVLVAFS